MQAFVIVARSNLVIGNEHDFRGTKSVLVTTLCTKLPLTLNCFAQTEKRF